jgi:D-lactate dehydrogenase
MNIVFFDMKEKEEINFLRKRLKGHELTFFSRGSHEVPISEYKNCEILVVFVYSQVTSAILKKLPKLTCVLSQSTGFDHIDTQYCAKKKIVVGHVPLYGENTVAEHTFALMLNLSRNVHKSYLREKKGDFSIDGLRGFDLKGKTLGVLGIGHIGLHVIKMARGFGMNVLAYDINQDHFLAEVMHYSYASMEEVLKKSDIITLHMPLNKYTKYTLNSETLALTKKGVNIINTSRGGLIDSKALYEYLKKGHISGAGLDVLDGEEYISHEDELIGNKEKHNEIAQLMINKEILKHENVIFTPHNAFNSKEAIERILITTVENIKEFEESGDVKFRV